MNIVQWFKNLFIGKGKTPTLADVILAYNHPFINYYPAGSKIINAEVHKITAAQAQQVANLIASEAKRVGLDPLFLAAALNQESMFDGNCYNKNLKEHSQSFAGTDWGIAQMAGTYLPSKPGMQGLNTTQMYLKAFDVTWAIPVFADEMLSLFMQAKTWMLTLDNLAAIRAINNTSLTNPEFIATGAYNAGFTGITKLILEKSTNIVHPFRVATWFDQFVEILNGGKGIPWNIGVNVTWKF